MKTLGRHLALGLSVALLALPGTALAQSGNGRLFFSGDMVVSPPKGAPGPGCVLSSQFKHNDEVVWRVRVLDQNGDPVTDADVKTMQVDLSSGETFKMRYGGHPHSNPADHFWTASWKIPEDYPAGSLSYKVVATTDQGATQTWQPFKVAPSQLTVLPGTAQGSGDSE